MWQAMLQQVSSLFTPHALPPTLSDGSYHTAPSASSTIEVPTVPKSVTTAIQHASPTHNGDEIQHIPPIILEKFTFAEPVSIPICRQGMRIPTGDGRAKTTHVKDTLSRWIKKRANSYYSHRAIGEDESRLLFLKPGAPDDEINVSLYTINDSDLGTPHYPYAALSYHWGEGPEEHTIIVSDDPTSNPIKTLGQAVEEKMNEGRLKEKRLFVRHNLYDALKHFRKEDKHIALWIDALCINQSSEDEKKVQVMKMNKIYREAYNVCVWLGSDSPGNLVSDTAMTFIPKLIDLDNHYELLTMDANIEKWACLFELLKWSWFSRRWVIQEIVLAKEATVHCGKRSLRWTEFQAAISIFVKHFDSLKPKLIEHSKLIQPRGNYTDESVFEIRHLGANRLVEITANLTATKKNGSFKSRIGLETLVCALSIFDSSDPRDTINAFRNICKESNRPANAHIVPMPDYRKDLFQVYRDFVEWVVIETGSIDIICRFWAQKGREAENATNGPSDDLPSWIQLVDDSAWGKGDDVFNGRKLGDSFVGLPENHHYHASGRSMSYKPAKVVFPKTPVTVATKGESGMATAIPHIVIHDMSLQVSGVQIGVVDFRTDPFSEGVVPKSCLEKLGWSFDRKAETVAEVPDQLWHTLVADRDPNGAVPPPRYKVACQHVLAKRSQNGNINIDKILQKHDYGENVYGGHESTVREFLKRVQDVICNRSFIQGEPHCNSRPGQCSEAQDPLVGFGPPKTKDRDVIVILYGCSVPVILRPVRSSLGDVTAYRLVGEAYIYGKMDGEAFEDGNEERTFKLI